ncbi:MAG: hypothetical protein ACYTJ0_13115 [Planctomycetota bacterium]|jgi:sugar/nucleoside kinase (ribokinase family)
MTQPRVVIGIGEVLARDTASGAIATGLAADAAHAAVRLGQVGVAVSRLGQDESASIVTEHLRARGIETGHLQSDPDLPTGRWLPPSTLSAGRDRPRPDTAFDNVQWDYDLPDLAQRADLVIYGALAARRGQTRSVIQQFLDECPTAARLFDLTNRPADRLDRAAVAPLVEAADVVLVDREALAALAIGGEPDEALSTLRRRYRVSAAVLVEVKDASATLTIFDDAGTSRTATCPAETLAVAAVSMMLALRDGVAVADGLDRGARAAEYAAGHPDEPVPASVLS